MVEQAQAFPPGGKVIKGKFLVKGKAISFCFCVFNIGFFKRSKSLKVFLLCFVLDTS